MLRWIVGSLHLLALGVGLAGVVVRGLGLRDLAEAPTEAGIRRVLAGDNAWGVAALLWLVTGLWRAFGGLEKGTDYYLAAPAFHLKITLFVVVWALEIKPMVTFIRWRLARGRGEAVDTSVAASLRWVNDAEVVLTLLLVFVAGAMARGIP